jgi:hypothetical protein
VNSYSGGILSRFNSTLVVILKRLAAVEALAARALNMALQDGGGNGGGAPTNVGKQYVKVTTAVTGFNSSTLVLGSGSGVLCDDSTGTLIPGTTTVAFDNLGGAFSGTTGSPVFIEVATTTTGRLTCDLKPC